MDKVSDFLKELGQRFSNPLIFSFIISWTFYNWKVPVALFFFSEAQLKAEGFTSYVDFISKTITSNESFWYPFWFAVAYTIFFPFIREGVKNFNIWVDVGSTKLSKRINSSSSIPMEKYYEMLENVGQKEAKLEQLISSESKLEAENISLKSIKDAQEKQIQANVIEANSLKDANSILERTNNELKSEVKLLKTHIDQSVIEGSWTASAKNQNDFLPFEMYIFNGNVIFYIDARFIASKIILFSYNRELSLVFFRLSYTDSKVEVPKNLDPNWLFVTELSANGKYNLRPVAARTPYTLKRSDMSSVMKYHLNTLRSVNKQTENFIDKDNLHR